jgi:hypothetical protein
LGVKTTDGMEVEDVDLPPWAHDSEHFIQGGCTVCVCVCVCVCV